MKNFISFILLAFVFTSLGIMIGKEINNNKPHSEEMSTVVNDIENVEDKIAIEENETKKIQNIDVAQNNAAVEPKAVIPEEQDNYQSKPLVQLAQNSSVTVTSATEKTTSTVKVYYFHGNKRCITCKKLEAYTQEALEKYFAENLKSGDVQFEAVNIDNAESEHFIKDYNLYTKSVVLSEIKNGKETKWKNLDKIWSLVSNKDEFLAYIQNNLNSFKNGQ